MLENCQSAQERWGGVNEIIDRWLQERQQMLVEYCSLSSVDSFDENDEEHGNKLKRLCQIMVDYVSAGHFEVYDQLLKEGRDFDDSEGLEKGATLFKVIDNTTEALLDFNDKYQETDDMSTLTPDLSDIGQLLETRFEAEDEMIAVLHVSHKNLVA